MSRSWQSMLDVIFNGYGQDKKHLDMAYSRQKLVVSSQFKHLKHFQHIFIVRDDKFFCCVSASLSQIAFIWNKSIYLGQTKVFQEETLARGPCTVGLGNPVLRGNVWSIVHVQYKWLVPEHWTQWIWQFAVHMPQSWWRPPRALDSPCMHCAIYPLMLSRGLQKFQLSDTHPERSLGSWAPRNPRQTFQIPPRQNLKSRCMTALDILL